MATNVIFLGVPGAGKGTQAHILQQQYGYRQLSTGDILRENRSARTALGRAAEGYMARGDLVPDDLIIEMVRESLPNGTKTGIIFDGFPRTTPQAQALDDMLNETKRSLPRTVYFRIDLKEAERRLLTQRQRDDDQPETIRHRFEIFAEQLDELKAYFSASNRFVQIDASQPVEMVTAQLLRTLGLKARPVGV